LDLASKFTQHPSANNENFNLLELRQLWRTCL